MLKVAQRRSRRKEDSMCNKMWLILIATLVLVLSLLPACRAEAPIPTPTPMPTPTPTRTCPEITLKFATWLPIGHPNAVIGYEYWANLVTERTNGAVKFEWYPSMQLIKGPEMLAGVGSGVADLGVVVPAYEAGRVPLRTFHSLPFAFETPEQVIEVYNSADDILAPELDEFNVISMYGTPAQFTILYTTDTPVMTVEDLKGLRIRTAGGLQEGIFLAADAVPQTMSSTEVYTSMQRGMLDGVASLPTSVEAHDWSEFVKYMIFTNHSMVTGSTIMNMDTWNSLSPECQQLMIDAGRDMQQYALSTLDEQTQEAIESSKAFGMDVSNMSEAERTKWKELTVPLWDEWLAAAEEAGKGDAARKLLQIVEDVTG